MTGDEIRGRLVALADTDYKRFNDRIIPTSLTTLGVRMPALKSFAKELSRGDSEEFLRSFRPINYEEIMLYGLTLGYSELPLETVFSYFDPLVEKFENWAHVDCIVGSMKLFAKNRPKVLEHFMPLFLSDGEFTKRTFVIILMNGFIDEEYIDKTLGYLIGIRKGQYYTDMAVAWALSVCFVKFWDETLAAFDRERLGEFVYKKTISKCADSFRISKEKKDFLKSLR